MQVKLIGLLALVCCSSMVPSGFRYDAAECTGYYAMHKGAKAEYHYYDANNALIEKSTVEIVDTRHAGNTWVASARSVNENLKKNESHTSSFDITCDQEKTVLNTIQVMEAQFKNSKDLSQSTASGNNPELPNTLTVGQSLPESKIRLSVKGEISLESEVRIFDRKVVAMETVTVPAGTFECAVITYTNDTRVLFDKITRHKIWMAKGVGTVQSEQYNKKGKLEKRSELIRFSR